MTSLRTLYTHYKETTIIVQGFKKKTILTILLFNGIGNIIHLTYRICHFNFLILNILKKTSL